MTLAEYLTEKKLSDDAFGELIGRSRWTVWRLKQGKHVPDPGIVRKILEVTEGAVTPNDLFGVEAAE